MGGMDARYVYSQNPLDRALSLRRDEVWLLAQHEHPEARYLLLRDLNAAAHAGDAPRLAWLNRELARGWSPEGEAVLLGLLDAVPHFALAGDALAEAPAWEGIEFGDTRALGTVLPAEEAGILAQARTMLDWHATHRFCGQCGAPTNSIEGGARRWCTGCGARSYPHISPSIIVLVSHGDRALLARRPRGVATRFSCLAGFMEPGESLEEAVAREVFEESHIRIGAMRYHGSQPWPFPGNLMVGFLAEAATEDIEVDGVEIAEARWFPRDEVRRAIAGTSPDLSVPDPLSISHHLIAAWANG
jgi:NAD+ diphosphatase